DNSKYRTWHFDGRRITKILKEDTEEVEEASLGENSHWMIKEIHDGPETVCEALKGRVYEEKDEAGTLKRYVRLGGLESPEIQEKLKWTDRIVIVACGTSYHAGMIGQQLI